MKLSDIPPEEFAHFGVKGQKWGVRNEEKLKGRDRGKGEERSKSSSTKPTKEAAQKLAANEAKWKKKFEDPNAPPKSVKEELLEQDRGWRPTGGQIALGAIGAAYVGLVAYNLYTDSQGGSRIGGGYGSGLGSALKPFSFPTPGEAVTAQNYLQACGMSKSASWGFKGFIQPSSYDQAEQTFPIGHIFHRISTHGAEATHPGKAMSYSTSSIEDFNRYLTAFRGEKGSAQLHHVTFKAKEEIKVPDLKTNISSMMEAMGPGTTPKQALSQYQNLSGGSWNKTSGFDNTKSTAGKFFDVLQGKGYSAIVDDMDAGVLGQSPLYIFSSDKFTSKVSEVITPDQIKLAESSLIEITNRKK
jgi:hypothetical protein